MRRLAVRLGHHDRSLPRCALGIGKGELLAVCCDRRRSGVDGGLGWPSSRACWCHSAPSTRSTSTAADQRRSFTASTSSTVPTPNRTSPRPSRGRSSPPYSSSSWAADNRLTFHDGELGVDRVGGGWADCATSTRSGSAPPRARSAASPVAAGRSVCGCRHRPPEGRDRAHLADHARGRGPRRDEGKFEARAAGARPYAWTWRLARLLRVPLVRSSSPSTCSSRSRCRTAAGQ